MSSNTPDSEGRATFCSPTARVELDRMAAAVYEELHRVAHGHLIREDPGRTLQTTALIHEAYLRLAAYEQFRPVDSSHFLALASQAMRRILIDHARQRRSLKRGGSLTRVDLTDPVRTSHDAPIDLLDLEAALDRLEAVDARRGKIVELRFYGGLTVEQTADVLSISTATVKREWRAAKAWLQHLMMNATPDGSGKL